MFISGHDYTTTISNCNLNYKIPDNIYTLRGKNRRAGSKKQYLIALGGMIMAWQVGLDIFEQHMKKISNRKVFVS